MGRTGFEYKETARHGPQRACMLPTKPISIPGISDSCKASLPQCLYNAALYARCPTAVHLSSIVVLLDGSLPWQLLQVAPGQPATIAVQAAGRGRGEGLTQGGFGSSATRATAADGSVLPPRPPPTTQSTVSSDVLKNKFASTVNPPNATQKKSRITNMVFDG